jgi:uncharacterized protein
VNQPWVVIDTNVLVSAAIKPNSSEEAILLLIGNGSLSIAVSTPILQEYGNLLRRPKFKLSPDRVDSLLEIVEGNSMLGTPTFRITVSPHEADNRFLECAEASRAHYLVTGNKRHFSSNWKATEILNARELQQRLATI